MCDDACGSLPPEQDTLQLIRRKIVLVHGVQAAACFEAAAAGDPSNLKALGNWGNALLAHGQVHFHRSLCNARLTCQSDCCSGWVSHGHSGAQHALFAAQVKRALIEELRNGQQLLPVEQRAVDDAIEALESEAHDLLVSAGGVAMRLPTVLRTASLLSMCTQVDCLHPARDGERRHLAQSLQLLSAIPFMCCRPEVQGSI